MKIKTYRVTNANHANISKLDRKIDNIAAIIFIIIAMWFFWAVLTAPTPVKATFATNTTQRMIKQYEKPTQNITTLSVEYVKNHNERRVELAKSQEVTHSANVKKEWLVRVAQCESSGDDKAVGYAEVLHCQPEVGNIYSTWEHSCHDNDVIVYRERPLGRYQILPSTFKRWNCQGDIFNGEDSRACASWGYDQGYQGEWECK